MNQGRWLLLGIFGESADFQYLANCLKSEFEGTKIYIKVNDKNIDNTTNQQKLYSVLATLPMISYYTWVCLKIKHFLKGEGRYFPHGRIVSDN